MSGCTRGHTNEGAVTGANVSVIVNGNVMCHVV